MMVGMMAAKMVAPKADQLAADWAELKVASMVVRKADWTVEGMAVSKAGCLEVTRVEMMVA